MPGLKSGTDLLRWAPFSRAEGFRSLEYDRRACKGDGTGEELRWTWIARGASIGLEEVCFRKVSLRNNKTLIKLFSDRTQIAAQMANKLENCYQPESVVVNTAVVVHLKPAAFQRIPALLSSCLKSEIVPL